MLADSGHTALSIAGVMGGGRSRFDSLVQITLKGDADPDGSEIIKR